MQPHVTTASQSVQAQKMERHPLDMLLERIGWGLFLIVIGGLWLLPKGQVPEGAWLLGAGLILLGLNVARRFSGIGARYGTVVLGIVAVAGGLASVFGVELPLLPFLLVIGGVAIVLRPLFAKGQ
jgi:hypothetical protein